LKNWVLFENIKANYIYWAQTKLRFEFEEVTSLLWIIILMRKIQHGF